MDGTFGELYNKIKKYAFARDFKTKGSIVGVSSIAGYRGRLWQNRLFISQKRVQ